MHERRSLSLAPASTPHRPESREQLKDVLGNAHGAASRTFEWNQKNAGTNTAAAINSNETINSNATIIGQRDSSSVRLATITR
jgi:hypothetical protein